MTLIALALAIQQLDAITSYEDCVEAGLVYPDDEGLGPEDALETGKAACGNLRPAAIALVKRRYPSALAKLGDDSEAAAQTFLDARLAKLMGVGKAQK